MKLNTTEEENQNDSPKLDFALIAFQIVIGAAIFMCTLTVIHACITSNTHYGKDEPEIKYAVITDLYKVDNKYLMDVRTSDNKAVYTLQITKSDFMKYKESDVIQIIINHNNKLRVLSDSAASEKSL